jgi:hypothetical protein
VRKKKKKNLETREELVPPPPPPKTQQGELHKAFLWYEKLEEKREMNLYRRERERQSSRDFFYLILT